MIAARVLKTIVIVAVFLLTMWGYYKATIPGYFRSVTLCSEGCHTTRVLHSSNITHPFWCIGCHGFGVKSEIIPWLSIPLYRDKKLELMVEEHGECLMCHPVPGEFHAKHLEASPRELRRVGLSRPIYCTDCHVNAYHGHHTEKPRDKVCIKCHDARKVHGDMVKSVRAACTACHSEKPIVPASMLAPRNSSYEQVSMLVGMLYDELGIRYRPVNPCLACHSRPGTIGHVKHLNATWERRNVTCTDCHLSLRPHGWAPSVDTCRKCHRFNETKLHDYPRLLADCYRCHRGFKYYYNETLMPSVGCEACHGDSLRRITSTGLHLVHLKAYGWDCGVCHNTSAVSHKAMIESAATIDLCKKCHDEYGGLKSEALRGLGPLSALYMGAGPLHALLVEKARGDCFKCHYEWFIVSRPLVYYAYPLGGGEK